MTVNFYVPEPEGHTWDDWTCAFINANPTVVGLPQFLDEDRWEEWAQELCVSMELLGHALPWPQTQPTWQEWVQQLSSALVAGL